MKNNISRREFIRTGALGAGFCLVGTLSSKLLATEGSNKKIIFQPVRKGEKGCTRCEKSIAAILKSPKMKQKLEDLLPEGAKIYFYVRQFSSSTKVPENSITVGNCTKAIHDKALACVKGCTKEIDTQYVFESIVKQLSSK